MSKAPEPTVNNEIKFHGTVASYILGFVLCLTLTISAYLAVKNSAFEGWKLLLVIAELGVIQLCVQLFLFLHLGQESKPRWNLMMFLLMLFMLGILVIGSLWIMKNLNYHMDHNMSPAQTDKFIIHDEGYQN